MVGSYVLVKMELQVAATASQSAVLDYLAFWYISASKMRVTRPPRDQAAEMTRGEEAQYILFTHSIINVRERVLGCILGT
jgi:hypothetical protein